MKIIKSTLFPFAVIGLSFAVGLFAACTVENNAVTATGGTKINAANLPVENGANHSVEFRTEPGQVKANESTIMAFTVKDSNGVVLKDLQVVHEKPMHLLIVSKDLAEFYHVHPELSADGSYRVQHTFPNGGDYKLYADFTPTNAKQVVERIDLNVSGAERRKVALVADTTFEKTVDGLKVTMKPDVEIKAGRELMLDFAAFDASSGKPAIDLQNYLGELAHFVIISEDMVDFVHAHPMAKGKKMGVKNAKDHTADGHSHGDDPKNSGKPSAYEVSAHATFPRAGMYKLWAQFQRGGKVISIPFVVNVPAGNAQPVTAANVPAEATKITVSSNGYEPASVTVKKGQPVRLAFYRADADNCGGEVVFAKQNIKKKLAVGETVLVEFMPTASGEIAFACGMNMLRGKVVVTEN